MGNENAFKNLINAEVVKKMGSVFHKAYQPFNEKRFQKNASKLTDFELKGRVQLLTECLRQELPGNFKEDVTILAKVLSEQKLTGFQLWPISEYISKYGTDHFDESLDLMYELTSQFTSEFAIRPFLQKDPDYILAKLQTWLDDENVHIRRWISEGTRPLLPWGAKIQSFVQSPATIHLLEALKYDEELYVRKSVANHLNDISKHHPDLVIKTLKEWIKQSPEKHKDKIDWIKKHALRTLIKKGHAQALGLMGVSNKLQVKPSGLKLKKEKLKLGDTLEFQFILESTSSKAQTVIIDYGIGFIKSNGSLSIKIFKLKMIELAPKESVIITKKHSLKKITTMTFYPGEHELAIQVNGKILKKVSWFFRA